MKANKEFRLVEMKHVERKNSWCLVNDTFGEYTVCGMAWTDSSIGCEDFEHTGSMKFGGVITCDDCKRIIKWFKAIDLI